MSIRIKRIIAFIIDWNITLIPFAVIFSLLANHLMQEENINPLTALLCVLAIIIALGLFVLRDAIFKSRSLGKRIFGLRVYEKSSLKPADADQCFLRNIFLFLYLIDGIILLISGRTIGDRAAGTLVLTEQGLEEYETERRNNLHTEKKTNFKMIVLICVTVIVFVSAFIGMTQLFLNAQKDTEEYKVAYSYLTDSQAFKELNVDESKVRLNGYELTIHSSGNEHSSHTFVAGFMVKGKSFSVVCHKENEIWQVCDECTDFE